MVAGNLSALYTPGRVMPKRGVSQKVGMSGNSEAVRLGGYVCRVRTGGRITTQAESARPGVTPFN